MRSPKVLLNAGKAQTIECLRLQGEHLCYSLSSQNPSAASRGEVWCVELRTHKREMLASFPSGVHDFGFDGASVLYAMDRSTKTLYRSNREQPAEVLATNISNSIHFACSGDRLVWGGTWAGANAVYVTKNEVIAPRSVASGFGALASLQADEGGIVFTTNKAAKRSGALYAASWDDTSATLMHEGMTYCRRAQRVGDEVWFSAYQAKPTRDGLFRMRLGGPPTLFVDASDPRGFRVEADRVVCGEYDGAVVENFFDGTQKKLAEIDQNILMTAVTDDEIFVVTQLGELLCLERSG